MARAPQGAGVTLRDLLGPLSFAPRGIDRKPWHRLEKGSEVTLD